MSIEIIAECKSYVKRPHRCVSDLWKALEVYRAHPMDTMTSLNNKKGTALAAIPFLYLLSAVQIAVLRMPVDVRYFLRVRLNECLAWLDLLAH